MITIDTAAEALLRASRTRDAISPLTDTLPGLSLADAYRIQRDGLRQRLADGETLAGHKVGLTSRAMQDMLGVDQPDFGYITTSMISPSDSTLAAKQFIAPRVEVEIAFRIGRELGGDTLSARDVLDATEAVAPALEIIDSRIADWRITIADTIADNASCGHVVLGEWRELDGTNLAGVHGRLSVTAAEGEQAVEGRGDAVLGHPARAVAWLVQALHRYGGESLNAGEIVLPGAMARALPVSPGCVATGAVDGLGDVRLEFSATGGVHDG